MISREKQDLRFCGWGLRIIGNLNLNQIFLKDFKFRFFFLLEGGEGFELEKILVESAKINTQ